MKDNTSEIICTWDENADCMECSISEALHCKWNRKVLGAFYAIGFPPLLISAFGTVLVGILTGSWWPLIAFILIVILFFGVFEIRILCSHCPYYAEESCILHCLANHGTPKLWRYHPEPMNRFERISLLVSFGFIFLLFPLVVQSYGIWFIAEHFSTYGNAALLGMIGVLAATILSGLTLLTVLRVFFCPRCVNFSCPLNTVPKNVVDEYLRRNRVMREAWERSGYRLE